MPGRRWIAVAGAAAAAAVLVGLAARSGDPQPAQPPQARAGLQAVLDGLVTGRSRIAPGATAFVSGPAGTWAGAAGLADAEADARMQPDARMRLESVSKIWTAALVLQLAEAGRLDPADTVEEWLPDLLPYGDRITIAQLLTHRSGLIDNNDMATDPTHFIARVEDAALRARLTATARQLQQEPGLEFSPLLWIRLAAAQPLLFEPGSDEHYSNIGFEILGLVAERASGDSIEALYEQLIDDLALPSAAYDPQGPIAGPHARAYRVETDDRLTETTDWHGGVGAEGGVVADAADAARFLTELMRGRVLEPGWVDRMRSELFWRGGDPSSCGTGFGHAGAGAGFSTQVRVSADGDRVAVLLLNGRAGQAGDERAERAIWQLFCAA